MSCSAQAQYNADQLLTLRDKVSLEIREALTKRAKDFHIHLDDVSIVRSRAALRLRAHC